MNSVHCAILNGREHSGTKEESTGFGNRGPGSGFKIPALPLVTCVTLGSHLSFLKKMKGLD